MKITEVIEPTDQELFEALDAENDTGFSTDDLVKIVKSQNGTWSKPVTGDEMIARLEAALGQHG